MRFSTGIPLLDMALGGGVPVGISEIYGQDGSGKTCLALSLMREATINGHITGFVNVENRADPSFVKDLTDGQVVHVTPASGEAAIESAYSMLNKGVKMVCIDTTDAVVPMAEENLMVGDRIILGQKRLLFHGLSVLKETAKKHRASVLITSQIRVNPREFLPKPRSSFQDVTTKIASCRVSLKKKTETSSFGTRHYTVVRAVIDKNTGTPPLAEEDIYLWSGKGFSRSFELFRALMKTKLTRHGTYWKSGDITLGPGYVSATNQISENYQLYWRLLYE